MRLDTALSAAVAARRRIVVPYVLVDRRRRRALGATVAALADGGATALELGFPFSDPIADGPVLAAAADRALRAGTDWSDLLAAARTASAIVPTAVMTYANPVLRHGLDDALAALAAAGVSGLIVPDLSLEEAAPWRRAARRAGVALVLLAAPAATPARTASIARASRGFLYLVSRYGTTGRSTPSAATDLRPLVAAAHRAAPRLPVLVGFGVRDAATAGRAMRSGADGVVVGSALEEAIARGATPAALARFLRAIAGPPSAR
ncbi:MAG TPA: tryptophan synthase subunit alpha [Thermoplasmata archaeon]|nr:tryptophan synthase subunit alpha [Thermoplasmata archaeon]